MDQLRQAFATLVSPGDGEIDGHLDLGALQIAAAVDPTVVIDDQLQRLDDLAAELDATSAAELALALFGGAGHQPGLHFRGNNAQYYDVENSLLNRVLDRRMGIPITLSVLLIEIGRRREVSLHGVGMPGHFLVGSADGYIDAFNRGVLLDEPACGRLFERLAGASVRLPPGSLDRTPPAMVLKRMLFNLAAIGANRQQRALLRAVRSLLATFPEADHRDHVQHAYAAAALGQFGEAAMAGERAMATIPEGVSEKLRGQIEMWRAQLN